MKKLIILSVTILVFASCKIQIESGLSNTSDFLNSNENSTQIYQNNNSSSLLHPFNCATTDYGRLIFINIDGHDDIKAVELVVQSNGIGSFIVVYYKTGKVECYPNQQFTADRKYLKPNKDWTVMPNNNYQFDFETYHKGLQVSFDITIKDDRHILVSVQNQTELEKQSFLAPIGADLTEVKRFPLVYLEQAGFLPIENTDFKIQIDGKEYPLKKIPLEVNGIKSYKTVYSLRPQPFFCIEERDTDLTYGKYSGKKNDTINGINYVYNNNNGHCEIKEFGYQLPDRKLNIIFSPALPDFISLKDGVKTEGEICINVNTNQCVVGGSYSVERTNNKIIFHINPEKGWQPMPGKPWVSFYDFEASFDVSEKSSYHIQSVWNINK